MKGIGAKRFEALKGELTVAPAAKAAAVKPDAKGAAQAKGDFKPVADAKART